MARGAHGGSIRIGISGWTNRGWRGVFYPNGLAHQRELSYAGERFAPCSASAASYPLEALRGWAEDFRCAFTAYGVATAGLNLRLQRGSRT
jgi:uncharacterized protein YecE (DUF72 family)